MSQADQILIWAQLFGACRLHHHAPPLAYSVDKQHEDPMQTWLCALGSVCIYVAMIHWQTILVIVIGKSSQHVQLVNNFPLADDKPN
jgi:hypothetical protein